MNYVILTWDPYTKVWRLCNMEIYKTRAAAQHAIDQYFCDEATRARLLVQSINVPVFSETGN